MCDTHWQLHLLGDIFVEYQLFSAILFAQWANQTSLWNKPRKAFPLLEDLLVMNLSYLARPPTRVR